jgi:glycosyltransferase involved in cell wall biosynthesis
MRHSTLGLALITRDEEATLPRLLESVHGCFDEIHVTDTGSLDRTVDIARSHNTIVHHSSWQDNFAATRNESFSHVTTDFIMWMDADDVLSQTEAFQRFRRDAMASADRWFAPYHVLVDFAGNALVTIPRERIVRRDTGCTWENPVFEVLAPGDPTRTIDSYIDTWSVRHTRPMDPMHRVRNLRILHANRSRLNARLKYYYGKELLTADLQDIALEWLHAALADGDLTQGDRIDCLHFAAAACILLGDYAVGLGHAFDAIALCPSRADLYILAGDCLVHMGRTQDAIPLYGAATYCDYGGRRGAG